MTDEVLDESIRDHYGAQHLDTDELDTLLAMKPPASRGLTERIAVALAIAASLVLAVPVARQIGPRLVGASAVEPEPSLPVIPSSDPRILADPATGPESETSPAKSKSQPEMVPSRRDQVKPTISRYSDQLKYCYQSRLRESPTLAGRVEIGFRLSGGHAENVYVAENSTGDDVFSDCILTKVQNWEFDEDLEGHLTWPFVFETAR